MSQNPNSNNLADAYLALARAQPDAVAIETLTNSLTYAGMLRAASAVAEKLKAQGFTSGNRLGIAMTDNQEALIVLLATWLCNGTALISDFRSRGAERKKLANTLDLKFFVEDRPAPGTAAYPALRLDVSEAMEAAANNPWPVPPPSPVNPIAVIGVSSGTSGMPQPVALSHTCLMERCEIARTSPQWQTGAKFAVSAPLAFSATRKHVLSRLLDGGTIFLLPLLSSAEDIAAAVNAREVEALLTVPAILRGLLPLAPQGGYLFPDVKWMMSCGAPMLPHEKTMARDRLSSGFIQNYGSTMAGMITLLETRDIDGHTDTVGKVLPQVDLQIVNESGHILPPGQVGAIRVRTPGAAAELEGVGGIEKRNDDLLIDGWIYPGDLGRLDEDGFLTIVGRTSDLIIRGGINVFPIEVEELLGSHPAVIEAAVVAWPDPVVGDEIAAFVVLRERVLPRAILAWCRPRIQPDKQPREVFAIPALPRNANGKVIKKELVSQLPQRGNSDS